MFTINIYLRFAAIAIGILGGIACWAIWGFWYGFPFLLIGIFLLIGYIMLGTVQSAALLMQTGGLEAAEERLKLTYFPQWLFYANRAYFYMIKGTIATQRQNLPEAEQWINKSLETGLPSDNEKAVAYLQLANIAASRANWTQVKNLSAQAKSLNVTEPMIAEQVKDLEKAMKNRGNMMNPSMMGQRNMMRGSKQRRPKQR